MVKTRMLITVLLLLSCLSLIPAGVANVDNGSGAASTPVFHSGGSWTLLPASGQNHWWLIDYWSSNNNYGKFTAIPNTIQGLANGDAILVLPMNLAYGSYSDFEWFQFDMQFNPDGTVYFLIWNVPNCNSNPTYNPHFIGLDYVPGHVYNYTGSIVNGQFRFQIRDLTAGWSWFQDFTVPSTTEHQDFSCFSPASAVEGYTSVSQVSGVTDFQFLVGNGITGYTYVPSGFGVPNGIATTQRQSSVGQWVYELVGSGVTTTTNSTTFIHASDTTQTTTLLQTTTVTVTKTVTVSSSTTSSTTTSNNTCLIWFLGWQNGWCISYGSKR